MFFRSCCIYNSHKFTQKVYIVNVISCTFSSGIRFPCKHTWFVVKSKNVYLKNYTRVQVEIYCIIASIYVNLDAKRLDEKLQQKKCLREFSELCKFL